MITYSEFIQTGIFIVALVSLCYTINGMINRLLETEIPDLKD